MNRLTLVLNTAILVVTFVVALTAGDVQGRLLTSATRSAGRDGVRRGARADQSLAVIRVVQSMENFYPATSENTLKTVQLEAIRDALELCRSSIRSGLTRLISEGDDDREVRAAATQLGRVTRIEVEAVLARAFNEPTTVRRLATEVIRNCQ